MGEKIRDLYEISLGTQKFMVEMNKGTHRKGKFDIHIQNSFFRLNVNEIDFLKIASCILYAEENMKSYKENKDE